MTIELHGKYKNLREYIKQLEEQGWVVVGTPDSDLIHSTVVMRNDRIASQTANIR